MLFVSISLFIWVFAAFLFGNGAVAETRRLLRTAAARRVEDDAWPALSILRPCAGLDSELEENLLSTLTAHYAGPREICILVATKEDPAYAIAERVRARALSLAPAIPVHVVVTAIDTLHNRKVAQLARATVTSAPVVVVIDSDLLLADETLPSLVAALMNDSRAGAASCPSVDVRRETLGDRAAGAVLSSTPHAFYCLAALAEKSGGAHVLCGALIAIKRRVLDELGGFASLERYLGEDFELARRLHDKGYTIPTALAPGHVTDQGRSLQVVFQRFARWATVTRQQRPHLMWTYPLFLACGPLFLLLGPIALLAHLPYAGLLAALIGIVLVVRVALAMILRRAFGLRATPLRSLSAMLMGELVILVSFANALGRPIVAWRGVRYRVGRGGLIDLLPDR